MSGCADCMYHVTVPYRSYDGEFQHDAMDFCTQYLCATDPDGSKCHYWSTGGGGTNPLTILSDNMVHISALANTAADSVRMADMGRAEGALRTLSSLADCMGVDVMQVSVASNIARKRDGDEGWPSGI